MKRRDGVHVGAMPDRISSYWIAPAMALAVQEPSSPRAYTGGARGTEAPGRRRRRGGGPRPLPEAVAVVGQIPDPAVAGDSHDAGFCAVRPGLGHFAEVLRSRPRSTHAD